MARLYNTFEFTGELTFGKEPLRVRKSDSGWVSNSLSFGINESKTNGVFLQLQDGINEGNGKPNVVYTSEKGLFGEKMSNIQVPWDDRLKDEIVNRVPDFRKVIIDLTEDRDDLIEFYNTKREIYNLESKENPTAEDKSNLKELYIKAKELAPDRHEFISKYDALKFFFTKLEEYKGRKFKVKGNIEKSYYNGKFYTNYTPQSIELVDSETPSKLSATVDLFFTKGSIDESDFKENKVLNFNTYILSYDRNAKKDVFFPHNTVLNASKLDFENPKHVGRVNIIKRLFEQRGKGVYHIPFEVRVFRGAERLEFTEADLTPMQREFVEAGVNKVEDFAPKDGLLGETIEEIRLIKPLLNVFNNGEDFTDGVVESAFDVEDLEFTPVEYNPPKQQVKEEEVNEDIGEELELEDLDDLLAL